MLNQDHVVAGVGALTTTDMLATVFASLFHQAPQAANSEAGLIVLALGALYGLLGAWLGHKQAAAAAASPPSAAPAAPAP